MLNNIILIGRLVADPEMRYTQSGIAMCTFRLAVDRNFKNQAGEKETDFINIVAWRKAAETICQYVTKGNLFCVRGALQTRKYQDKDGNNRTSYDVVVEDFQFLEPKRDGAKGPGQAPPGQQRQGPGSYGAPPPEPPPESMMDDDLPF